MILLNNILWAIHSLGNWVSKLLYDPCFQFKLWIVPGNRVIQTLAEATVCCIWLNQSCGVPQLLQQVNDLVCWLFVESTSLVFFQRLNSSEKTGLFWGWLLHLQHRDIQLLWQTSFSAFFVLPWLFFTLCYFFHHNFHFISFIIVIILLHSVFMLEFSVSMGADLFICSFLCSPFNTKIIFKKMWRRESYLLMLCS